MHLSHPVDSDIIQDNHNSIFDSPMILANHDMWNKAKWLNAIISVTAILIGQWSLGLNECFYLVDDEQNLCVLNWICVIFHINSMASL